MKPIFASSFTSVTRTQTKLLYIYNMISRNTLNANKRTNKPRLFWLLKKFKKKNAFITKG